MTPADAALVSLRLLALVQSTEDATCDLLDADAIGRANALAGLAVELAEQLEQHLGNPQIQAAAVRVVDELQR